MFDNADAPTQFVDALIAALFYGAITLGLFGFTAYTLITGNGVGGGALATIFGLALGLITVARVFNAHEYYTGNYHTY